MSRQTVLDKLHQQRRFQRHDEQRGGIWRTPIGMFSQLKRDAREKKVQFQLTREQFGTVLFSRCSLNHPSSLSNDIRLRDEDLGYILSNIELVCQQCQSLTSDKNERA